MTAEIALLCDRCERRWAHFPTNQPGEARGIASKHGWKWRIPPSGDVVEDICPECVKEGAA